MRPLELLFNPLFKSAVASLAVHNFKVNSLCYFAIPPKVKTASAAAQWAGISSIVSGGATVTVSTTAVKSDSVIMLNVSGNTRCASGIGTAFEVTSKVHATAFTVTTNDGLALARTVSVMWMIVQKGD